MIKGKFETAEGAEAAILWGRVPAFQEVRVAKILVLEDEPICVAFIARVLENAGYTMLQAETSSIGLFRRVRRR